MLFALLLMLVFYGSIKENPGGYRLSITTWNYLEFNLLY